MNREWKSCSRELETGTRVLRGLGHADSIFVLLKLTTTYKSTPIKTVDLWINCRCVELAVHLITRSRSILVGLWASKLKLSSWMCTPSYHGAALVPFLKLRCSSIFGSSPGLVRHFAGRFYARPPSCSHFLDAGLQAFTKSSSWPLVSFRFFGVLDTFYSSLRASTLFSNFLLARFCFKYRMFSAGRVLASRVAFRAVSQTTAFSALRQPQTLRLFSAQVSARLKSSLARWRS